MVLRLPRAQRAANDLHPAGCTPLRTRGGHGRGQPSSAHPSGCPWDGLTLGGLLNHLALVEDSWFRVRFSGLPDDELRAGIDWDADPDHEFRTAAGIEPAELRRRYEQACARSREVVAGAEGLDQISVEKRQTGCTSTCDGCCST